MELRGEADSARTDTPTDTGHLYESDAGLLFSARRQARSAFSSSRALRPFTRRGMALALSVPSVADTKRDWKAVVVRDRKHHTS